MWGNLAKCSWAWLKFQIIRIERDDNWFNSRLSIALSQLKLTQNSFERPHDKAGKTTDCSNRTDCKTAIQEIEYTVIGQLDGAVSNSLIQPSAQVIDGVKARIKDCLHDHSGPANATIAVICYKGTTARLTAPDSCRRK